MPYGNDPLTKRIEKRIAEIFERDCAVFLVGTGTAANALALGAVTPPYGAIFCHPEAHINSDECGAPEFYSGGAKLVHVPGMHGKIAAADLAAAIAESGLGNVHHVQASAVSLSQVTEAGTVYSVAELKSIANVAHDAGLALHVDGARFANALVSLGCSPAEATWKAGVDVLSFGATKNGAFAAEAVVFFDPARARDMGYRRKRAGQLWSKMRFIAAQFDGYLSGDLWLKNARVSNRLAAQLGRGLDGLPGVSLDHPVQANEVFVSMSKALADALEADGFAFYRWDGEGTDRQTLRLVTHFAIDPAHVAKFVKRAQVHAQTLKKSV
jgi:threonine aldolase